jgi:hypothetical protein
MGHQQQHMILMKNKDTKVVLNNLLKYFQLKIFNPRINELHFSQYEPSAYVEH